jgi:hypothetical protein
MSTRNGSFDVGIDSPEEAYMAEASKHPVFDLSVIEAKGALRYINIAV